MRPVSRALIAGRFATVKRRLICTFEDREVHISAPQELIKTIAFLADGTRTFGAIQEELSKSWPLDPLLRLLGDLEKVGVLVDADAQSLVAWERAMNRPPFAKSPGGVNGLELARLALLRHASVHSGVEVRAAPNNFGEILQARQSERVFGRAGVPLAQLAGIAWAAYGFIERSGASNRGKTVPSAGALYPLEIFMVLLRASESLDAGIYSISFDASPGASFTLVNNSIDRAKRSFIDQLMLEQATAVFVLTGSFSHTENKYGNRAMLYVPLEAGHAAQNALLASTAYGLAAVEVGGFAERALAASLSIPSNEIPLTTVVVGGKSAPGDAPAQQQFEIYWAIDHLSRFRLPFSMCFARPAHGGPWSCGRDADAEAAYAKATAEAVEWASCGNADGLEILRGPGKNLNGHVAPDRLISFHKSQLDDPDFKMRAWTPQQQHEWVAAENFIQRTKHWMLADLVLFPYSRGRRKIAQANSSGAAAYTNRLGAIQRGAFELLERDAFMVSWLNRLPGVRVRRTSLPQGFARRLHALDRVGFKTVLLNIGLDFGPVAFVVSQSRAHTMTTCAAAYSLDTLAAFDKALMEVEASVFCKLENVERFVTTKMSPQEVVFPADHGLLYEQPRWYREADFYFKGKDVTDFSAVEAKALSSWQKLLSLIEKEREIYVVDLKVPASESLNVVKIFITGLVPMSFGFNEEPLGMERLFTIPEKLGLIRQQLSIKNLNRFPHPFN